MWEHLPVGKCIVKSNNEHTHFLNLVMFIDNLEQLYMTMTCSKLLIQALKQCAEFWGECLQSLQLRQRSSIDIRNLCIPKSYWFWVQ